eukprot:3898350-Ditylum_brightwellii.AAC.1
METPCWKFCFVSRCFTPFLPVKEDRNEHGKTTGVKPGGVVSMRGTENVTLVDSNYLFFPRGV